MRHSLLGAAAAATLGLGLPACVERGRSGTIAFQLASRHAPPNTTALAALKPSVHSLSAADSAVVSLGRDSVVIRRVELVLKDIQLAPRASGECESEEEVQCAPLMRTPVLIDLPLGNPAKHLITVGAPADTYIVFQFAIHKPNATLDPAFLAAHPDFAGISIRVEGTFSRSGTPGDFVFTSDFNEQEETALLPPLTVSPGATANLTLRMDLATWFLTADRNALIDPATANPGQPNQGLVQDNIRTSVAAFRDDDHDGLDDHNETSEARQSAMVALERPDSSPWPADQDSGRLPQPLTRNPGIVPQCRQETPLITQDSVGPFHLDESLSELKRKCPRLAYRWVLDPDGFPVPAVAARLGRATITALLSDTLPTATVHQVTLDREGPKTAEGVGVGSTLRELQQAYGAPGASEPGCVLRVWFESLPGLAFHMRFPASARRECGGLSEQPLPPDLRVTAVILVPR